MASLAEFQQRLQADIMQRTATTLPDIKTPSGADKAKRLAVYQNAYKLRLTEVLGISHEKLWAYVGDEQFRQMADRYFDVFPSSHPNARFVSTRLPQFLRTDERYSSQPVLAEIAAIEEALEDVFDVEDTPVATMEDLAAMPPAGISNMTLIFTQAVQVVQLNTNALEIYQALKDEAAPPKPETAGETRSLLIWRQELTSRYRETGPEEEMLLEQARAGKPFAALCEMASVMDDPDSAAARVAGYLTGWINAELISQLRA